MMKTFYLIVVTARTTGADLGFCQGERVAGWPQKIFETRSAEKIFLGSSRGVWGHASPENF